MNCESGGQDLTPNNAGASGYYQFMPGTWNGYGGYSQAYQAPKSLQDQRAAQVWNGGAGSSNWVAPASSGSTDPAAPLAAMMKWSAAPGRGALAPTFPPITP